MIHLSIQMSPDDILDCLQLLCFCTHCCNKHGTTGSAVSLGLNPNCCLQLQPEASSSIFRSLFPHLLNESHSPCMWLLSWLNELLHKPVGLEKKHSTNNSHRDCKDRTIHKQGLDNRGDTGVRGRIQMSRMKDRGFPGRGSSWTKRLRVGSAGECLRNAQMSLAGAEDFHGRIADSKLQRDAAP